MLELLSDPQTYVSLATLTVLEIVLGVDNIIVIAIVANKLPKEQRQKARTVGLALALITRLGLLATINWLMGLNKPLTPEIFGHAFSGRDFILGGGGIFLIVKSAREILEMLHDDGGEDEEGKFSKPRSFGSTVVTIMFLDIVFSLDSVITAVGMAQHLPVMMAAVIAAVIIMLFASGYIARFVETYPSMTILALSFLVLIGLVLLIESCGVHVPRAYIYTAMGFSVLVELINITYRRRHAPEGLAP